MSTAPKKVLNGKVLGPVKTSESKKIILALHFPQTFINIKKKKLNFKIDAYIIDYYLYELILLVITPWGKGNNR